MSEKLRRSPTIGGDRVAQIHKHLAECTPERLQDELDDLILSTDGSDEDVALIDAYLEELDKRAPLTREITAEESLKAFCSKHAVLLEDAEPEPMEAPAKKRRRPARFLGLVAAVVAVTGLLAMQATGADLFGSLARWSSDTFGFSYGAEQTAMERNPEYEPLQQALEEAGITTPLVPKYLPEGYMQTEFYTVENDQIFFARYGCGDAEFGMQFRKVDIQQDLNIQKNDSSPEIITINNVDHYVIVNNSTYTVVWENDGYECSIHGVINKDELNIMIESIYMEDIP